MESLTSNIKDGQNGYPAENGYPGQNGRQVDPMPRSEAGKVVSEEVYWRDYYEHPDFNYEWNNGILEEKPMADVRNAAIYRWLLIVLESYLTVNPIAQLVNLEIGFRLPLPQKISIRKPDLFAVRNDNPVPLHDLDRNYMGIVDLAIESLSDSTKQEVERDTVHKKSEYEGVGVQEYYILDASRANMAFYHRTATGQYVPIVPVHGDVIRSTVLPGFQFRIRDLFQKPSLVELSHIPTYRQFILPEHQSALAQLDATSAKLDATSAQLDAERQKSARLLAKLRELGIAEDEL
ncbi:MAG: Uma2 family endonuclease [Caldilineaceae bacterium]|nr:Uma2 family endonuclease [Caldilineaceae bacterium]